MKYLLWDHDGVLVDTERWYFLATQACLSELGCEYDQATHLERMAAGGGYWNAARAKGISEEVIRASRSKRNALYQHYLATKEIEIHGVSEVLAELRGRYRMAIVTTARREDFELIHRYRKLREHFEFVLTLEDYANAKPAPDPYQQALRRFNANPEDAVAIEDSPRGLRSALAAGLRCVIIRNEFTAAQDFTGAWRIINAICELPELLNGCE